MTAITAQLIRASRPRRRPTCPPRVTGRFSLRRLCRGAFAVASIAALAPPAAFAAIGTGKAGAGLTLVTNVVNVRRNAITVQRPTHEGNRDVTMTVTQATKFTGAIKSLRGVKAGAHIKLTFTQTPTRQGRVYNVLELADPATSRSGA